MNSLVATWKNAFSKNPYRTEFIGTTISFILIMHGFTQYLEGNEIRQGVFLADPILRRFEAVDLTWPLFGAIYGGVILSVFHYLPNPARLLKGFQVYALLIALRWAVMWATPLEAPEGMILLRDPVVQFFGESGAPMTKDLFFSGHTSTMFMLFLLMDRGWKKNLLGLGTVFIGVGVLLQKVHYSVDVFAAPFFAYGAYRLVMTATERFSKKLPS